MGQIRKDAQLNREAKRCLIQAIEIEPRCWPAWDCLISLVKESDLVTNENGGKSEFIVLDRTGSASSRANMAF